MLNIPLMAGNKVVQSDNLMPFLYKTITQM